MKQTLWNSLMRLIRHGFAPVIIWLTEQGHITGEQGATLENAVVAIASILFAIAWSWARTAFPAIRLLG